MVTAKKNIKLTKINKYFVLICLIVASIFIVNIVASQLQLSISVNILINLPLAIALMLCLRTVLVNVKKFFNSLEIIEDQVEAFIEKSDISEFK